METLKPSCKSSPCIRGAPQVGFSRANEAEEAGDIDRDKAEADLKQSEEDLAKSELPEEVDAALTLARTAETRIDLSGK